MCVSVGGKRTVVGLQLPLPALHEARGAFARNSIEAEKVCFWKVVARVSTQNRRH